MNRDKRTAIFKRFRSVEPEPRSELTHDSPFELLIAVILSAQATDKGVNKATARLFPKANTPRAILDLGEDGLKEYIGSIGLYRQKARNIIKTCRILVEEHNGAVPNHRDDLEDLPGVGRKTANVVLNSAFGEPVIAVDTHVFRVANRTRIAKGDTPREVEDRLARLVPDEFKAHAHHWLILHGRYVCRARRPQCERCIIADLCEYPDKTSSEPKALPVGEDYYENGDDNGNGGD